MWSCKWVLLNIMEILFGVSRNSTYNVSINTFFRVSSNCPFRSISTFLQPVLWARNLTCTGYLSGLAFILPLSFHLTVRSPDGEGGEWRSLSFPQFLSVQLPVVCGPLCLLTACTSIHPSYPSPTFLQASLSRVSRAVHPLHAFRCKDRKSSALQVLGGETLVCVLPKPFPHIC